MDFIGNKRKKNELKIVLNQIAVSHYIAAAIELSIISVMEIFAVHGVMLTYIHWPSLIHFS